MNQLRDILLVEDNPNDVELTMEALGEHNLANKVIVAHDGEDALDFLYRRARFAMRDDRPPAFILLDIKLPKLSGLEVLRAIRSDEKLKCIPVVMLTSSREESDLFHSYQLGVNAYVVKPVAFAAFLDAVKEIGAFWAILNELPPVR
ncbi:MAG: response regulator [Bryobacterales bacterium]|nr:response regulator [Bryobacterales bacterium]MCZ2149971.1 response regulator [Bryobacterales bacterium]